MRCDSAALSAYLDGEVSEDVRQAVEAHLEQCAECRAELERFRRIDAMLGVESEQPGLHLELMRRADAEDAPVHESAGPSWWGYAAVVAAMVSIAGLAALMYSRSGREVATPAASEVAAAETPALPAETPADQEEEAPVEVAEAEMEAVQPAVGIELTPPEPVFDASTLPLELAGVLMGEKPVAIITYTATGRQRTVGVGAFVLPDIRVAAVAKGKVTLRRGDAEVVLTVGRKSASQGSRDLDGTWLARVFLDGSSNAALEDVVQMTTSAPGTLTIQGQIDNSASPITLATATLKGDYLVLNAGEGLLAECDVSGSVTHDGTRIRLEGDIRMVSPEDSPVQHAVVECKKITEGKEPDLVKQKECEEEVRVLCKALQRYADDHDGQFPGTLRDLLPNYLSAEEIGGDSANRTIRYFGGASPSNVPDVQRIWDETDSTLPYPDRLMAWENRIEALWGGDFPPGGPLIEVEYKDPAITVVGSASGSVRTTSAEGAATSAAAMRAIMDSSSNNLKQLGLVVRMFANEHNDYTPPGWACTYPEYITDPEILRHPADASAGIDYELFFPATHDGFVHEITGQPDDATGRAAAWSTVPLAAERTPHRYGASGELARIVLFWDGHVEVVRMSEWETRIAPYIEYR